MKQERFSQIPEHNSGSWNFVNKSLNKTSFANIKDMEKYKIKKIKKNKYNKLNLKIYYPRKEIWIFVLHQIQFRKMSAAMQ